MRPQAGAAARLLLGGPDADRIHVFARLEDAVKWERRVPGGRTLAPAKDGWQPLLLELRQRRHRVRDKALKLAGDARPSTRRELAHELLRLGAASVIDDDGNEWSTVGDGNR